MEAVVNPSQARHLILKTAKQVGRIRWELLRAHATVAYPGFYTDSDLNKAIKKLVARNELGSTATGAKIDNSADVWPMVDPMRIKE